MCGDQEVECPLKVSTGDENCKPCDEMTPSTCDEVNTYYDENEGDAKCNGKKTTTFDEFIAKRKRLAAGTGGLMGESQSEVESGEYRTIGAKKKKKQEDDPSKTGFGTGTMIDYQRNPSYSQ